MFFIVVLYEMYRENFPNKKVSKYIWQLSVSIKLTIYSPQTFPFASLNWFWQRKYLK